MNLNNEDKRIIRRNIITLIIPIVFVAIFLNLDSFTSTLSTIWSIISPFLIGIIIAFILNIPMSAIERQLNKTKIRKKNIKRAISIIASLLLTFGLLVILIAIAIPQLIDSLGTFLQEIPIFIENILSFIESIDFLSQYTDDFEEFLKNLDLDQFTRYFRSIFGDNSFTIENAFSSLKSIIGGLADFFIGLVFSIYCLATKETLIRQAKEILYTFFSEKNADWILHVTRVAKKNFSNFFAGQVLEAVILGVMVFIGMIILNLPFAPLIAPLVGIGNLIPFVGAFLAGGFGFLIIFIRSPVQAIIFLILLIILQRIEGDFIYPKVVGSQVGIPSIWVLVGITLGGSIGGIFGIVMGVPLTSTIYSLLKEYKDDRLKEKNINVSKK